MSNHVHQIQSIFRDVLLREEVTPTTDLLSSGLLDSMSFVELLFNLEQRFGLAVNLADLDFENFRSINQIAALVAANTASSELVKSA